MLEIKMPLLAAASLLAAPLSALTIEYVEAPPAGVFISSPFALPGFDVIFSDGIGSFFAEGKAFGAEFSIPAEAGFWLFLNGDATVTFADVNGPIPVEPYGSVTTQGRAYRKPTDKVDFYSLLDNWLLKDKEPTPEQQHFVMATLIRGGVFGDAGKD